MSLGALERHEFSSFISNTFAVVHLHYPTKIKKMVTRIFKNLSIPKEIEPF